MAEQRMFREGIVRETAEGPVLLGSKCKKCGTVFFPSVNFCSDCLSEDIEEKAISRNAELYTYTITRAQVGNIMPPNPLGTLLISEDKLSIVSPLAIDEGECLEPGTKMEPVIEKLWVEADGTEILGYKFRQAKS